MRRPLLALLGLWAATASLLVSGLAAVAVHEPTGALASPVERPGRRASKPSPAISAVLLELQAFVERERGLKFLRPVDVELLDDQEFGARAGVTDADSRTEITETQSILRAMGLLSRGVDLVEAVESFAGEAILGLYDAETKELLVRGTKASPFVRSTLVHELTHALEDQHFNLLRPDLGDEAATGFQALAEGSALRIEGRYIESLTEGDRREAARDEASQGAGIPRDLPEVVQAAFGFPYAFGPDLVRAVFEAGGQSRLDAAFATPPSSSEHVLDPKRFLANDAPRPVPTPRPDRPSFDDGEIGELFLILMLRAELSGSVAREAAKGWGGDHYVAWVDGRRTCVRMDFVMDSPADTRQLTRALADWAARRPRTASASGTSLRTCG